MTEGLRSSDWNLHISGCIEGEIRGILSCRKMVAGCPPVVLSAQNRVLATAETTVRAGSEPGFDLSLQIPMAALNDGVQVLTIGFANSPEPLAFYPVSVGQHFGDDASGVLARLEAEFAMLRRAFLAEMAEPPLRDHDRPLIVAEVLEALNLHDPVHGADGPQPQARNRRLRRDRTPKRSF